MPPRWLVHETAARVIHEWDLESNENLVVITNSIYLRRRIARLSPAPVAVRGRMYYLAGRAAQYKIEIKAIVDVLARLVSSVALAKRYLKSPFANQNDKPVVLIRNFSYAAFAASDGSRYDDLYFKGFKEFYEARGFQVLRELDWSVEPNYPDLIRNLGRGGCGDVCSGYRFFRIADWCVLAYQTAWALYIVWRFSLGRYEGRYGLDRLILRVANWIAFTRLLQRIGRLRHVILNWENFGCDKAIMRYCGVKYPELMFAGAGFSVLSPLHEAFLCWERERNVTPFPHRLLFAGNYMKQQVERKYPELKGKIRTFPSWRQQRRPIINQTDVSRRNKPVVLMVFSSDLACARLMLAVAIEAKNQRPEIDFHLKPHIDNPAEMFSDGLDSTFTIESKPIPVLLMETDIAVYSGPTTVPCETFGLNLRVMEFRPPCYYTVDTVNWREKIFPVFSTVDGFMALIANWTQLTPTCDMPYSFDDFFMQSTRIDDALAEAYQESGLINDGETF
ncbi:MAG: hypothetical protein GC154_08920 [bacterium]|nr:hypothetical protein [bacterium]